jgi:cytidylate kinase
MYSRLGRSSISNGVSNSYTVVQYNTGVYYSLYTEVSSELESKSGERLTALHSKLQQEAEKIRKWKNATEVEIKQKVREYLVFNNQWSARILSLITVVSRASAHSWVLTSKYSCTTFHGVNVRNSFHTNLFPG